MIAAVVSTLSLGVAVAPSASAADGCNPGWRYSTTKGQTVWVPSSLVAGPFQWGGSQSITVSDGRQTATTKGSADTVGGSTSVKFGVAEASARYDHQWNRSTTDTTTYSHTFTTQSPRKPESVHWRWRLYQRGHLFKATKSRYIPAPCLRKGNYTVTRKFIVPTTRTVHSFHVELYRHRGFLLDSTGTPFKPW